MRLPKISIIIPYYNAPLMLGRQLQEARQYPGAYEVVIVDDCGSPPAATIVSANDRVKVYRIQEDIPWNREGARNLGAVVAVAEWILHVDIDHVLPVRCAERLLEHKLRSSRWYRFPRWRVGRADDTRKKDDIPDDQEYGQIKPHIDSYLCRKELYWRAGGYNEDYSGCLGGGGPFLKILTREGGTPLLLPPDIYLEVYTRSQFKDASVADLSRDKEEFKRRRGKIGVYTKAHNPLRFKWQRVM